MYSFLHFFGSSLILYAEHSSCEQLLGPKKSPSKSTYIGPKVHIVATWGTGKQKNLMTPFEGLVVLKPEYPPIWAY